MDPLLHLCKILLICSIVLNFYLINLSLKQLSIEECFTVQKEYKLTLEEEIKKSEKCLQREVLRKIQEKTTKPPTTTLLPKYEEELKKYELTKSEELSIKVIKSFENNDLIRNCITGDVVGKYNQTFIGREKLNKFFLKNQRKAQETKRERLESFKNVFYSRAWGRDWDAGFKGVSASGQGSTVGWSQEVVGLLHSLINTIKFEKNQTKVRVLDIACGDMVWMSRFLETRNDIEFTGLEIVPELIKNHLENFKSKPWKFYVEDIVETKKLAFYDIIIARMVFQHWYNHDILRVLNLISKSKSSYLVTTTFPNVDKNKELDITDENPGRFREINLEIPPFSLIPPVCYVRDGPLAEKHYAAIWKLPLLSVQNCGKDFQENLYVSNNNFYTCSKTNFLSDF